MKILGIDDSFAVNELLDTFLNGSGHDFTYVDNGKKGLEQIRSKKFDLVFLDLTMPGIDGLGVIHTLRKEDLMDKQKIIIFTASSATEHEFKELEKLGVHSCIRKPVDVDVLLGKINGL